MSPRRPVNPACRAGRSVVGSGMTSETDRQRQMDAEDASFLAAIAARLRLLRARRGMTRQLLARRSGISERYIAQMEAGRGNVSVLLLRALARALGVPPVVLLEEEPAAPVPPDRMAPARRQRVALVGLRGAGKSTLGRMLAAARGVPFHELDREVERAAGMDLPEMFELHGQTGFRRFERAALERLLRPGGSFVLAAGGSLVTEPETYALLLRDCWTVWVRAAPEEHMARVVQQGDMRPMRDNRRAMQDLRAILASREALYARADATLDTSGQTAQDSARALAALVP